MTLHTIIIVATNVAMALRNLSRLSRVKYARFPTFLRALLVAKQLVKPREDLTEFPLPPYPFAILVPCFSTFRSLCSRTLIENRRRRLGEIICIPRFIILSTLKWRIVESAQDYSGASLLQAYYPPMSGTNADIGVSKAPPWATQRLSRSKANGWSDERPREFPGSATDVQPTPAH